MGLVDGSVNNAHVVDHSNILGVLLNSKIDDNSNSNANTRAEGMHNDAVIDDEDTPVKK
jgi:hypothetical protein